MPEDQNNQGRIYRPNTFQMPNVMVDVWLTELSGSEFKVAAYICRHTYGWNKESDGISLSQMMKGVKKLDTPWAENPTRGVVRISDQGGGRKIRPHKTH